MAKKFSSQMKITNEMVKRIQIAKSLPLLIKTWKIYIEFKT